MSKLINYTRAKRYPAAYVIALLTPFIGLGLYAFAGWWMFFSYLAAYFVQLVALTAFISPKYVVETIEVNELDERVEFEQRGHKRHNRIMNVLTVLNLFPLLMTVTPLANALHCPRWLSETDSLTLTISLILFAFAYLIAFGTSQGAKHTIDKEGMFLTKGSFLSDSTDIFEVAEKYHKEGYITRYGDNKDAITNDFLYRHTSQRRFSSYSGSGRGSAILTGALIGLMMGGKRK